MKTLFLIIGLLLFGGIVDAQSPDSFFGFPAGISDKSMQALPMTEDPAVEKAASWQSYEDRYAIIVMGGDVSGIFYEWYWTDTYGMYTQLKDYGFTDDDIIFLSYGPEAQNHPDEVDGESTTQEVINAYNWAQQVCSDKDLLYIFWVDHGSPSYFVTHDSTISHAQLGQLTDPIDAKQVIGAYNPCYSGAIVDDVSRMGVITTTSQDASHPNSFGWAGAWRKAVDGGTVADPSDTNQDGHVSMTEAYIWTAQKSQAAGEHPLFDDNGDSVGHELGDTGFDPDDPDKDGYIGSTYSLDGYLAESQGDLIAKDVWISKDGDDWNKESAVTHLHILPGADYYFYFEFEWTGNESCASQYVEQYLDGSPYYGCMVSGMSGGSSSVIRCDDPWRPGLFDLGGHTVEGMVDVYDTIDEPAHNNVASEDCIVHLFPWWCLFMRAPWGPMNPELIL